MKAYAHFLTPSGRASIVERGPWHYGVDYVSVYFRAEPDGLQQLLPAGLKVNGGRAVAYVSEFVSVSENNPEAVYENPAQTIYREAGVGVACSYDGRPGLFLPFVWVDKDWSLIRGWLNGYPKKIADEIQITKLHPLNSLVGSPRPGARLSGYCTRHGRRLLAVRLQLKSQGTPDNVVKFGSTYGLRHFPSTDSSQASIWELVEVEKYDSRVADVWVGEGNFEFGGAPDEELELVKPVEIEYGCHYKAGFTIGGAKVLRRSS